MIREKRNKMNEPTLKMIGSVRPDGTNLVLATFKPDENVTKVLYFEDKKGFSVRVLTNQYNDLIAVRLRGFPLDMQEEESATYEECIEGLCSLTNVLILHTLRERPHKTIFNTLGDEFIHLSYSFPKDSKSAARLLGNIVKLDEIEMLRTIM